MKIQEIIDESLWVGGPHHTQTKGGKTKFVKRARKPLKPFKTRGGPKHKPTANVSLAGGGTTGPGGRGTSP